MSRASFGCWLWPAELINKAGARREGASPAFVLMVGAR